VITQGLYAITRGGESIGHERFRFTTQTIHAEGERTQPSPCKLRIDVSLDSGRALSELTLVVDREGELTSGRFRVDRAANTLRALVQPAQGASIERMLPFEPDDEIAFPSPLAVFLSLSRMRLRPGERREVRRVSITTPTLMPDPGRVRWQRMPDAELRTRQSDVITVLDFRLETLEGTPVEDRVQANLLGLPLRMRCGGPGDAPAEWGLVE
jgi:hypothetical protein